MATQESSSAPQTNSDEMELWEDEILREVYALRDAYAAEHGYDLDRIYADLKRREATSLFPLRDPSGTGIPSDPSKDA